jgi:HAD superfamily hydrolase (TIGR01509 family)
MRPGATELLCALCGRVPLAVASNTPKELVVRALEAAGLKGDFDVVITADDVESPKPAPDIYLAVCRWMGVEPSATVALEDSAPGIEAARQAGITVVAVPQWPDVDTSAADDVVPSLRDLVPLVTAT